MTEKSSRVHTSAVTVAILSQADEVLFCLDHAIVASIMKLFVMFSEPVSEN